MNTGWGEYPFIGKKCPFISLPDVAFNFLKSPVDPFLPTLS